MKYALRLNGRLSERDKRYVRIGQKPKREKNSAKKFYVRSRIYGMPSR